MAVRFPQLRAVAGWYDDLLAGTMARVSHTGEKMHHERLLLWSLGRISDQAGAGGCGLPMETCGKKT